MTIPTATHHPFKIATIGDSHRDTSTRQSTRHPAQVLPAPRTDAWVISSAHDVWVASAERDLAATEQRPMSSQKVLNYALGSLSSEEWNAVLAQARHNRVLASVSNHAAPQACDCKSSSLQAHNQEISPNETLPATGNSSSRPHREFATNKRGNLAPSATCRCAPEPTELLVILLYDCRQASTELSSTRCTRTKKETQASMCWTLVRLKDPVEKSPRPLDASYKRACESATKDGIGGTRGQTTQSHPLTQLSVSFLLTRPLHYSPSPF